MSNLDQKSRYSKQIEVINAALDAAASATRAHLEKNPGVWYPCGFASVKIRPARGAFVSALKEMGVGRVDSYDGGYSIWNPSGNSTQWLDAKAVGAAAFAEILKEHGINCSVITRLD